jgi:hypothetical protein
MLQTAEFYDEEGARAVKVAYAAVLWRADHQLSFLAGGARECPCVVAPVPCAEALRRLWSGFLLALRADFAAAIAGRPVTAHLTTGFPFLHHSHRAQADEPDGRRIAILAV